MIKIGIIGVGTIGAELARRCRNQFQDEVQLIGIVDTDREREAGLRSELGLERVFTMHELIRESDLIIEAATQSCAYAIAKEALSHGKDVMLMSAGGVLHKAEEIHRLAREHRSCVYLPSGAIAGLDGLKSADVGVIRQVSLITRKSPASLKDAPFVVRNKVSLNGIHEERMIFEGSAQEAIEGFPQNINIAATLSLAGLGPHKTRVKIYVCPGLTENIHEVHIEGEFGSIDTKVKNRLAPQNPKTSYLAVLSAIATLRRILDHVKIGT